MQARSESSFPCHVSSLAKEMLSFVLPTDAPWIVLATSDGSNWKTGSPALNLCRRSLSVIKRLRRDSGREILFLRKVTRVQRAVAQDGSDDVGERNCTDIHCLFYFRKIFR